MSFSAIILVLFRFLVLVLTPAEAAIKKYQFDVAVSNVSRLCHAKPIVVVNGRFPGPTIYAREGDRIIVNVTNYAQYNMTIHWHGVKQLRNGWADGPAYITQCPIQMGRSYTYDFNLTGQRGTLWWHAHILWLRATVHGAIIIMPPAGVPYPFPRPDQEAELILGEWWNADVEVIVKQGDGLGLPPNTSDAHTINGKPGPLFPCPEKHTYAMEVEYGKTYLLRIINAALNDDLFFAIAGHNMTVVEIDATYATPFSTAAVVVAPGQTTNVLVRADQSPGQYFIAARPFVDVPLAVDNKTATAVFQYKGAAAAGAIPGLLRLPAPNDTAFVADFQDKLRSLAPANLPASVDRRLFYTIGMGVNPCPTCVNKTRLVGSLNNITFVMPEVALLQAHYNRVGGVYRLDFPDRPTKAFNYTGAPLTANLGTSRGTRLGRLAFNSTVELVLQDTNLLMVESHPFHLHGYNFFVVGRGIGNFDPAKDPAKFNLIDPPERNTVAVPTGGWTAIRFRANNPGVWFMHCHLEVHTTWGLKMAFLVEDGDGSDELSTPDEQSQLAFLNNWLDAHVDDARNVLRKPLLVAEFGKSTKDPGFSTDQRDAVFRAVYSKIYASARTGGATAGSLFWQLMAQGMESYGDGYEIVLEESAPTTTRLIAAQSRQLRLLSGARAGGGGVPEKRKAGGQN